MNYVRADELWSSRVFESKSIRRSKYESVCKQYETIKNDADFGFADCTDAQRGRSLEIPGKTVLTSDLKSVKEGASP